MTQATDRIDLIRRGTDLFNRRRFGESLRLLAADPSFEWDTTTVVPDGRLYRGTTEVEAYWSDVFSRWHEFRIEPEEYLEGENVVVMLGKLHGKGAESGVPIIAPWHQVWTFSGETPVRCENYNDREMALRAAGIDEG